MVLPSDIVFVSSHYPINTYFAIKTRATFKKYTKLNGYHFYYDTDEVDPSETEMKNLHYRRCINILKASHLYPNAKWFVWVDSDVYVNNYSAKVEEILDLDNENILYHLFHEKEWGLYPINTGVKFVNRNALKWEETVWKLRNTEFWTLYPYEQRTIYEYVLPRIGEDKYIIHDPYLLNCMIKAYPDKVDNCMFAHMCAFSEEERNQIMRKTYI